MKDKNLTREETEVAKAIEHDVATGVTPEGDLDTYTRTEDLLDKDPGFIGQVDNAIAKGDAEWNKAHPGTPSPERVSCDETGTPLAGGESGLDDE